MAAERRRGHRACRRSPSPRRCRPCRRRSRAVSTIILAPNDFTTWPPASNFRIGASGEPTQAFAPQRSPTQIEVPVLVDRDGARRAQRPPLGKLRPAGIDAIGIRHVGRWSSSIVAHDACAAAANRSAAAIALNVTIALNAASANRCISSAVPTDTRRCCSIGGNGRPTRTPLPRNTLDCLPAAPGAGYLP